MTVNLNINQTFSIFKGVQTSKLGVIRHSSGSTATQASKLGVILLRADGNVCTYHWKNIYYMSDNSELARLNSLKR